MRRALASLYCKSSSPVKHLSYRSISYLEEKLHKALENVDATKYANLLEICQDSKCLSTGRKVHAHMLSTKVPMDDFLCHQLIIMFTKCGSATEARQVLDQYHVVSVAAWTATIAAYAQKRHFTEAFYIFHRMQLDGVTPNKVTYVTILSACTTEAGVRSLHDRISSLGLSTDVFVGTALVNAYGKLERLEDAWNAFEGLSSKDLIAWNALLSALSEHQEWRMSLYVFNRMQLEGLRLDSVTFLGILKACGSLRDISHARLVHDRVLESGLQSVNMVGNAVVDMYGKCGNVSHAREAFERLEVRDIVSWNTILAAHAQNGDCPGAVHLFKRMLVEGVKAERITLATLLHSFASLELLEEGKRIHSYLVEQGLDLDVVMATALLNMYARCGSVDDANDMFRVIPYKDIVLWNTFISALSQAQRYRDAFQTFRRMQLDGVLPNRVTFTSVIDVCTSLSSLSEGRLVTSLVVESGLGSDTVLGNAIIDLYGKCGSLDDAWQAFQRTEHRDVVSWTTVLAAFSQYEKYQRAVELYEQMLLEGILPSKVTFTTVLYACAGWKALRVAERIHACIVEVGLDLNESVRTSMLAVYGECGELAEVCRMFRTLVHAGQDVLVWNAMMVAYARRGLPHETVDVYRRMQMEGIAVDRYSLVSVLEACSALRDVKSIESRGACLGLGGDDVFNTALLKAYGRCGSMSEAGRTFDRTPKNDVVAWSAMVAVHAQHGVVDDALEVFGEMQLYGVTPNDVSFVSVLAACSHSGKVERGYECFFSMEHDYGLRATSEHCKCMIDLLGRAGRLGEAECFMERVAFEPDMVLWSTLLGACTVHGNLEMGEQVAYRILQIDDENEAAHVGLARLYAAAGKVKEAEDVREALLKKKVARSEASSSAICVA